MLSLPFNIPQSLLPYAEYFTKDKKKAILRLKNHLKKRGPDAVGYFLLAWFYHLSDDAKSAAETALRAKTYAAGSPLMQHLHYFLVHPELFEAVVPEKHFSSSDRLLRADRLSPLLDLDALIAMLESVEAKRIEYISADEPSDKTDLSKQGNNIDDIASETLAKIHLGQGNKKEAVKIYERLMEMNEDKKDRYQAEIDKILSS